MRRHPALPISAPLSIGTSGNVRRPEVAVPRLIVQCAPRSFVLTCRSPSNVEEGQGWRSESTGCPHPKPQRRVRHPVSHTQGVIKGGDTHPETQGETQGETHPQDTIFRLMWLGGP